jgi:hypothetical protein
MPHQALTPVRQPQAPHPGQEGLGFRLNGLGQQPAGAAPQDGRQRVVDRLRLMQRDNGAIACHRRIAPSGGPGRLCHPPRYAALLTPPSPSFGHSSPLPFTAPATLVCSSPCAGRHPGGAPAACRAGRQPAGAAGPGRRVRTAAKLDFLPAVKVCCTADTGTLGFGLGQCFQPADSPRSQASTAA